ncbi:MAG: sugar ABC transporter substrate-binding protein [Anaerolineae bacterium]|nr:sugar ABC transporter substrate-binding protein [Anaerolineae bacterium]
MGTAEDLLPAEEEITAAQAALGDSVVGIISCTMGNEWHAAAAQAAADRLAEMGLAAEIFDSQADTEVQISGIESFTSRGVGALIICVLDPPAVENALQEAADAGIAIVQYAGRESAQAFGGISIAIEDADLGWAAGEYAGQLITGELGGEAEVVILDYPDLPNVVLRADNIEAALLENAPNATIVGRFLGGTPDNGLTSMENALQAFPGVNVVVSINDAGAYGALQALEAAGKAPGDVIVVGIDAEDQALQYLDEGYFFRGTVSTAPASNGALAADAVVKLLAGADAPANVRVPIELITAETLPE